MTDIKGKGGKYMDINSIMSAQVSQLQQTLQISIMDKAMNIGAASTIKMLNDMPEQTAVHPYKGNTIDISV